MVMALLMGAGISVQVAEASSRVMRTEDVPTPVIRFAAGGASANCGQTVTMQVTNAVEGYYYCWYTAIPDAGNPTANLVGIGTELTIPEIFASATYYVIPVADLQLGTPVDFNYTGAAQTYIPTSSVMKLEVWGAQGGGTTYTPGMGGYSVGTLVFPEISPMYVYVGGRGVTASTSSANWAAGGFNGGGAVYSQSRAVGSGGGATDIRVGGSTLYHRIIVAGGGGGSGVNSGGNYGGGTNGGGNTARSSGTIQVYTSSGSAGCGTQTSGGNADVYQSSELANSAAATFGQGAVYYALHTNNTSTGGGGGGWYGGGVKNHQGGGGGSGFVWTAAALSTVQNLPGDFMIPTDYYLTDASTIAGNSSFMSPTGTSETGHSGDGFARITPYVPTAFAGNYAIQQITVSLNLPNPNNVMTSAQSEVECGNAIQLSANVEQGIIQWYASPEGNVLLGTTESGESLTIFPAVGNTTYYALAIASNGHCTSAQRVATSPVTVVPAAAPTIAGATISCGESVLLSVQNSEERYNYYWFTDAECTQLVHIGDTYLTPELNATQTYYVEARLAVDLDTTFAYTGTVQSFDIPDNVHELVFEVWGAQGGASTAHGTVGGNGGYAKGVYSVPDDVHTLYINVGGKGNTGSYAVNGGWNGGGGVTNEYYYGGAGNHLGTGGGATDIATVYSAVTLDDQYRFVRSQASYESRLIVAAGGGGAENANGGVGGGAQGGGVNPGTQSAAGANASWAEQWVNFYPAGFGYGISVSGGHTEHAMGACGGGGWYGGGCYDDNTTDALIAGAGGSGYVGSLASSILLAGDQEMPTPTGEGTMVGNSGNGYARIYAGPHCSSEATPVHVTVTELSAPTVENSSITAACSENVTLSASSSDEHTRIVWYEGDEMIGFGDENGELTLQPTVGTHHYYAESQRFIVDSTYYRFENMNGSITSTSGANSSYGYLFTPIEDIYVYKLRSYFGTKVTVYDANGNALAILPLNSSLNGSWQEVELERPLHLAANTNYYLAAYSGGRTVYYQTSAPSCQHASLTRRSATGDQYLTSSASYYYLVNMVYSTGLNDTTICQSPTRAEVTATITRYPAPRITMVSDLGCGEPLTLSVSNRPEHSRLAWYADGGRTLLGYSSDDEFEVLPLADTNNYYATFVGDSPFDTLNLWNQYSTGFTTVSARDYTYGYSFVPSEDIVVTHLQSYFGSRITIWNSISEEVARVDYPSDLAHWTTVALDEPVVLTAGQTYTIGCYTNGLTSYYSAASAAAPTFRHGHLGSYYYGVNDVRPTSAGSGWYPVDFVYHLENDAEQAGCEPNFAMVSVSPQHPTEVEITNGTTRQSVCGEPVTMTHSALGDGDRVAWYDSATGGNLLGYSEDDQFTAVPTASETHYFAENQRITVDTNASSLWGALGEASTSTTSTSYTYGYCIQPDTNITVYKLRHYFGMNVNIWNSNGGLLASAAYTSGQATAQSWSETALPVPVVLEKGAVYYIGAYSGGYAHYYQTAQAPYFPYGSIHATYNSGNGMPSSAAGTTTYYQNPMVDFVYGIGADTLICSSAARTEVTVVRQDLPAPTVSISEDAPSCGEEIVLHAAPLSGARIAWFNGSDTLGYSDGHGDLRIVPSIGETTYSAEYQSDYISHAQYTLWDVSATPQGVSQNAYTFGYRFTPNEDITVSAFRHTFGKYISLWEQSSNYLVARKEVSEAGGLWQTTALDTPITLVSGMTYVLSAYQPSGASYFGSSGYHPTMAHGTLTASTSNMWYSSGDGYPNSTSSSYPYPLIDIVYSVPGGTTMPCPASQRSSVDVEVTSPSGPVVADYPELSCGDNCTLQVENASPDKVYYWYDDAACTNLVNEGPVFVTPYLDSDVTYYVVSENIMEIDTAFRYTGGERTFVVPEGIDRLTLQVWGAQGGTGWYSASTSRLGGKGGYAQGTLAVAPGDVLYINVGGKGQDATSSALADSSSFAGGYNGGGRSGAHQYAVVGQGGGGGGATHIAKVSGVLSTLTENKNDVLIVAGGGGGGSYNAIGGAGGGASGISSNASGGSSSAGGNGYNGSAYYGGMKGLFGQGGCGASYPGRTGGGGGGGGWYGGGGGSTYSSNSNATNYSGGGGSGYVSSQLSSTQNIAGNASLPDTVSGNVTGRVGDGYARITASGLGCRSLATAVPIVVNQYATPDITSLSPSVTCGEEAVLTTELPGEGAQVAWYDAYDNLLGYATNATDHTTFSVLPRSGSETYYEKIVRYSYSADDLTIMGTPETVPSTYSYGYPYTYGYSFTPNTAITVYELRSHFGSKVSLWQGSTLMATAQLEGGNADWQNVALDHPVTLAAGTTCYVGAYANGTKYKYYPTAPTFANGSLGGYYYSNGDTRPVSYTAAGWPLVDIVYSVAELDTTVCQGPPQSVTVTMTGLPAPTVSTQSQTIACGSSLSLQASSSIPDSQIVWFSGEDEQPIGYGGSLTVNPDEATTYYAELQRSVEAASGHRFYDHTPVCDSLNNSSYYYYTFGYRITPSQDIRLTKLYRFFGSTIVVYDASNNIIYRENCSSYPRGQWTEIPVCEDVVLQANTNYYLGAYMGGERYLYYTTSYTPRFGHGTMLQTYASGNSYPTSSTSTNTWQNVPVGFGYVVLGEAADVFSCAPARSQGVEIALSAVQAPAVEAPAPITCGNTTTLEIADPQAGMTYLWYDDEECTHQVGEGSTFTTPTLSSTTAYYVKSAVLNDVDQTYDAPGVQTYVVPQGVRELHLQVWGAQGGNGTGSSATVVSTGGHGGYAEGILQVTPGEKLHVYVGGQGESSPGALSQYMLRGGFNGGADAGVHNSTSYTYQGGAGGGATDIRLNDTSLYSRIIVAGGGGGAGSNTAYVGGQGGGVTGGNAASSYAGYGGTATAGGTAASSSYTSDRGSFGRGGNGVTYPSYCGSGGGGGGWYGGSGGALNGSTGCGGGGAGSGFVWKNGASVPAGYRIGPERYLNAARTIPATASSAVMPNTNEGGGNISGRTGNGFARISGHGIGCLSGPTEVEVVVNEVGMPVPTNDAAELTVSCGESVFLNTTSEPNTRVAWYDAPENGNLLGYASIIEDEGDAGIVTRFEVVPSDDTTYYYAESQRITIDTAMRSAFFENSPCFEETYGPNSYTYGYRIVPDDTLIVYGLRSCFGTKVSLWNSYGQILAAENLETNQNGTWQEAALDVPVVLMPNQTYYLGAYSGGLTSFRNLTAPTWQDGTLTNLYSTSNSYPTSSSSAYYLVDFVYGYDFGDTTCCTSSERTEVAVTVNSLEAPVILNDTENPESLTIECGEEVVLTTSSAPQYRIAWFDAAENGNLLGYSTDNSFRASPDFSTTYYAETQMTTIRHDTTATANMLGDYGHTSSSGTSSNTYGFRFTPDVDVWVTKVRHYFGTKVSVWDANGTLVGSQTVANAYGNWNETSLDAPFALRAGQTYTVGCYAGGSYYYTNGTPLTRFANGTIDGYYYYSGNGFPNSSTSNYVLVDLIYSVTSVDTVVCNSPERSSVGIVVGDIEDPTADDVEINCGQTATLHVNAPNPLMTYYWYDSSECDSVIHQGETFTTPLLNDNTTYYVKSAKYEVDTMDFHYTGTEQVYDIPAGTSELKLAVWGAQGGNSTYHGTTGGKGGYAEGTYIVPDNVNRLYVYVGGQGTTGSQAVYGGWNGGGGVTNAANYLGTYNHNGTGGGATDIATQRSDVTDDGNYRYVRTDASYRSRIIVAGGGGGAESSNGGVGGGLTGGGAYPGTQEAAGGHSTNASSYVAYYPAGFGYGISVSCGHTNHAMGACGGGGWYGGGCSDGNGYGCGGSAYSGNLSDARLLSGSETMPDTVAHNTTVGRAGNGFARVIAMINRCESNPIAVNVTVNSLAVPTVTSPGTTLNCGDTAELTAETAVTDGVVAWYTEAEGGAPFAYGSAVQVSPDTTTTYYAETRREEVTSRLSEDSYDVYGSLGYYSTTSGYYTMGYDFVPDVDVQVEKFRHYYGTYACIWDSEGGLLAGESISSSNGTWKETPLSAPVTLLAGRTYRIGVYAGGYSSPFYYRSTPQTEFGHGSIGSYYYNNGTSSTTARPTATTTVYAMIDFVYNTYEYDTLLCASTGTRPSVTVNVEGTPAPTAETPEAVYCGQAQTLRVDAVEGCTYYWYDESDSLVHVGESYTTPLLHANTTYRVRAAHAFADTLEYSYTGDVQRFVVPTGTDSVSMQVWGAQGGTYSSYAGGKGGYAEGRVKVAPRQTLYVYVGGTTTTVAGGYNGGGNGMTNGKGGGGSTDIRTVSGDTRSRLLVAGGGGGAGVSYGGGYGGGLNGGNGYTSSNRNGFGGTQTGGGTTWNSMTSHYGSFGQGGSSTSGYSVGGGGGWYGGGAGYDNDSDSDGRGGGGGSGYVYTAATASSYPSGCLLDGGDYLSDARTVAGNAAMPNPQGGADITGNTGDGHARIIYNGVRCFSPATEVEVEVLELPAPTVERAQIDTTCAATVVLAATTNQPDCHIAWYNDSEELIGYGNADGEISVITEPGENIYYAETQRWDITADTLSLWNNSNLTSTTRPANFYTYGYRFVPSTDLTVYKMRSRFGSKVSIWKTTSANGVEMMISKQLDTTLNGTWQEVVLPTPVLMKADSVYYFGAFTGGRDSYYCSTAPASPNGALATYSLSGDGYPSNSNSIYYFVDIVYSLTALDTVVCASERVPVTINVENIAAPIVNENRLDVDCGEKITLTASADEDCRIAWFNAADNSFIGYADNGSFTFMPNYGDTAYYAVAERNVITSNTSSWWSDDDVQTSTITNVNYTYGHSFIPNDTLEVYQLRSFFGSKVTIWDNSNNNDVVATANLNIETLGQWNVADLDTVVTLLPNHTYYIGAYCGGMTAYYRAATLPPTFQHGRVIDHYYYTADGRPNTSSSYWYLVDMIYAPKSQSTSIVSCNSEPSENVILTFSVLQNPTVNGPLAIHCSESAILHAEPIENCRTAWYDAPTGGNLVGYSNADGDLLVSPEASMTYYAETQSTTLDTVAYQLWNVDAYTTSSTSSYTYGYKITPSEALTIYKLRHFFGSKMSIWNSNNEQLYSEDFDMNTNGSWTESTLEEPITMNAGESYYIGAYANAGNDYYTSLHAPYFAHGTIQCVYASGDALPATVGTAYPYMNQLVDFVYTVDSENETITCRSAERESVEVEVTPIEMPELPDTIAVVCGETVTLSIGNANPAYTYYWYTDSLCEAEPVFVGSTLELPATTEDVDYYVRATIELDTLFTYTGTEQSITLQTSLPALTMEVWGAQGGYYSNSTYGGMGGYSVGTMNVLEGDVLYVYVGGSGNTGGSAGGFNGGGARATGNGGGGASDVRVNGNSEYNRVIVAGGGGSEGSYNNSYFGAGGYGGGLVGGNGYGYSSSYGGQCGTQINGGAGISSNTLTAGGFGRGGAGRTYSSYGFYGAGGGGWYGGAGAYIANYSSSYRYAGGGGSGFVWTAETAENVPYHYDVDERYYLTDASTIAGNQSMPNPLGGDEMIGNAGNGYVHLYAAPHCFSAIARTTIDVINPAAPEFVVEQPEYCGDDIVITVDEPIETAIYYWYDDSSCTAEHQIAEGTTLVAQGLTGDSTYFVRYSKGSSCYSEIGEVTVSPLILAEPTISGNTEAACGEMVVLTATNGNDNAVFSWYSDENCTQRIVAEAVYTTPELSETTTYYARAYLLNGAGDTVCTSNISSITILINHNSLTTPVVEVPDVTYCGNDVDLTISQPNGSYTYSWYDDALCTNWVHTGVSYTIPRLTSEETYYVVAIYGEHCTSDTLRVSLVPTDLPAPTNVHASTGSIHCGELVTLSANAPEGTVVAWYDSDTSTTSIGSGNLTLSPTRTTTYFAQVQTAFCHSSRLPVTVTVDLSNPTEVYQRRALCDGETFTWDVNGQTYNQPGQYTYRDETLGGCDIIIYHLDLMPGEQGISLAESELAAPVGTPMSTRFLTVAGCSDIATSKVAVQYELRKDGQFVDAVGDLGTLHLSTLMPAFDNLSYGVDVEDGIGYIPGNTFTMYNYSYDYFYAGFLSDVDNNITATWNEPGEYELILRLYERVDGSDFPFIHNGDVIGGAGSHSLRQLAADTLYMHVGDVTAGNPVALTFCESNLPATYGTANITEAGEYEVIEQTANGYVSHNLIVTVTPTVYGEISIATCAPEYTWYGTTYSESGDYIAQLPSATGCDSIVTLHLALNQPNYVEEYFQDACDNYVWNSTTYTASGDYSVSASGSNNCDTTRTLHLTIHQSINSELTISVTQSQLPYDFDGNLLTETGDYEFVYETEAGCDSILTLHLLMGEAVLDIDTTDFVEELNATSDFTLSVGNGSLGDMKVGLDYEVYRNGVLVDNIANYGVLYFETRYEQLDRSFGRNLTAPVGSIPANTFRIIFYQYDYFYLNFWNTAQNHFTAQWHQPGEYRIKFMLREREGGHDFPQVYDAEQHKLGGSGSIALSGAIAETELVMNVAAPTTEIIVDTAVCEGNIPIVYHGESVSESTTLHFTSQNGVYDTVVIVNLTVLPTYNETENVTACGTYVWNNETFTESGVYTRTLLSVNGCDSMVTLNLTINPTYEINIEETACGSYVWNNETFTESGVYTRALQSVNGCDSVVTLNLTINPTYEINIEETACGSYVWNNETFTESGVYMRALQSVNGCDSVVTLNLTINSVSTTDISDEICQGEAYTLNGFDISGDETQTTGTFSYQLETTSVLGCDSLVNLMLTVVAPDTSRETVTVSVIDLPYVAYGRVFEAAGVYEVNVPGEHLCDDVVVLTLNVRDTLVGTPFLVAQPSEDGYTLRAYANSADLNTKVSIVFSLYKDGHLVENMDDECGGTLYIATEFVGHYFGRNINVPEGSIPTNSFTYSHDPYDYFFFHFMNHREHIVSQTFTESGEYEVVFQLMNEVGGLDHTATYIENGLTRRIGGKNSLDGSPIGTPVSVTFTVAGPSGGEDSQTDAPSLLFTSNDLTASTSLDTLTCLANTYDLTEKVSIHYTIYRDDEVVDYLDDYGAVRIETYYAGLGRYFGKPLTAPTGSIPLNTFSPSGSYVYNYFYFHFLNSTHSRITATWNQPGEYKIAFDLVAMTGGTDNPQTWADGMKVGGRSANSTDLILASDTLRYHIGAQPNPAPTSVTDYVNEATLSINLYPNPAKMYTTLTLTNITDNTLVTITDVNGKLMKSIRPIDAYTKIDVSDWAQGVYLVTVSDGTSLQTKKLIIAK